MYWPDLRHIAEMDRALRRHAELQAAAAKVNAEKALRRYTMGQEAAWRDNEADVEDAEWREFPQERLPAPAQS